MGKYYCSVSDRRVAKHVLIWEKFMEVEVPFDDQGRRCIIHHLDQNPRNNEITNLACVTISEHIRWHASRRSPETLAKMRESGLRQVITEEHRRHMSESHKGHKFSDEIKKAWSIQRKGDSRLAGKEVECPICGKKGKNNAMRRWHFDNCRSINRKTID
jgi:hypothetical protein